MRNQLKKLTDEATKLEGAVENSVHCHKITVYWPNTGWDLLSIKQEFVTVTFLSSAPSTSTPEWFLEFQPVWFDKLRIKTAWKQLKHYWNPFCANIPQVSGKSMSSALVSFLVACDLQLLNLLDFFFHSQACIALQIIGFQNWCCFVHWAPNR